ncbi:MAG: flagellar basal-body MS-ring/collar protein FliF [bacterium]
MAEQRQTRGLLAVLSRLTPVQKMILGGTVAAVVVAIVVGGLVISRASYSVLYSGLRPEEAGQILEQLEQRNIRYRIAGGGGTILVPSSRVYEARIGLASEGFPRSGAIGFEIFDKTVFGMTEFLQKVNYRRALEGELAKTIMQMEGVEAARVHIVIPEKSLFKESQEAATASVVLKMSPARKLSKKDIEGITYLVASAVEGLEPDRVTILDSKGAIITKGFYGNQAQPGDALELKQQVETYLEQKAQTLLDGVLGPGKSVVRVAVDLNLERVQKNIERYDPEGAVIISEQRSESSGGPAGSGESSVTNYEISKTVESIASEVGNIKRLSVAVMVDGRYERVEGGGGTSTTRFVPRSDDEITRIAAVIKSTVGFDDKRGDYFEIASTAFDRSYLEEEEKGLENVQRMQFYFSLARKAPYVVGFIIGLLFIVKLVKKTSKVLASLPQRGVDMTVGGGLPSSVEAEANQIASQIARLAERNPEQAAGVISSMVGGS